ncbi:hypothetical protein SCMU_16490 [Sinomonas cyclohexanicum]|uniref:4'-phosphopantetheinyl transferase domain-containing protein n=1 Tax=Sinomonas cyclohexanicum TaxID=322009 RepID=A0ABN6FI84_SINCY|nr:4'-phosphopantetheinyl transferase superfamily protein [Corynebacterium cyclohexanicum]BCT75807.1 hypothetical protein SCMU_16490 [Corynebacterium cyclohexanicum]
MLLRAVPLGSPGSALPAGVCTPGELERAAAMVDPARRHGFLAGRLALRAFVAELLGVDPELVVPAYACPDCGPGEHGVPGFALAAGPGSAHDDGGRLPLDVAASMSRAGGWAILAAEVTPCTAEVTSSRARPGIGVDLAFVADFRDAIPKAAFSATERRRAYRAADPPGEAARLWARKEALLKALGTGLRADPSHVETVGESRVHDLDTRGLGLPEGFVAALART